MPVGAFPLPQSAMPPSATIKPTAMELAMATNLFIAAPPIQDRIIDESKLTAPLCYRLVPESHTRWKKLTNPSPYGKRNEVALLTGAPGRRAADDVVYPNL